MKNKKNIVHLKVSIGVAVLATGVMALGCVVQTTGADKDAAVDGAVTTASNDDVTIIPAQTDRATTSDNERDSRAQLGDADTQTTNMGTDSNSDSNIDIMVDRESDTSTAPNFERDTDTGTDGATDSAVGSSGDAGVSANTCASGQNNQGICLVSGTIVTFSAQKVVVPGAGYILKEQTLLRNRKICGSKYCITGRIVP